MHAVRAEDPLTIAEPSGLAATLARVNEITTSLRPAPAPPAPGAFAATLQGAAGASPAGATAPPGAAGTAAPPAALVAATMAPPSVQGTGGAGPTGRRIAELATAELGVSEAPLGSNDAPRIAEYRTATRGSGVGPWCAYFTSWIAQNAGVPIGPDGAGMGYVPDVRRWAAETGRLIPPGTARPQAGDLVIFDRGGVPGHIGVVTGVRPDGSFTTVEGNSSDRVSARSYSANDHIGFVRLAAPGT